MPKRLLLGLALVLLAAPAALAAEGKKETGSFVAVDTLTATVMATNGRRATMTVQCGVDVADPALRAFAETVQPRLRDAFLQALQLYTRTLQPGAPPDPDYLAGRLQEATDRVLGKPGGRFLFGGIMIN